MPAILLPGSSKNNGRPLKPGLAARVDREHPLSTGLVGCWLFNEGGGTVFRNLALSGKGNGIAGSGIANAATKFGRGISVAAAAASSNEIITPDITDFDCPNGYTLEAWVYLNATGSVRVIAGKGSQDAYNIYYNGVQFETDIKFNTTPSYVSCPGSTTVAINTWYHVVGTWDGTLGTNALKLYVNGKLDGQVTPSATMVSASGTGFFIGGGPDGANDPSWNGLIDFVRLWKRALSLGDITKLFNQPFVNIVGQSPRYITVPAASGVIQLTGLANMIGVGRESFNPVNGKISKILAPGVGRQSVTPVAGKLSNLNATGVGRESFNPVVGRISLLSAVGVGRESISAVLGKVGLVSLVGAGRESFNPLTGKVTIVNATGVGRQSVTPVAGKLANGSFTGVGRQTITPLVTKQGTFVLPGVGTFKGTTGQAILQLIGLLNAAGVGRQSATALVTKQGKLLSTGAAGSVVNPLVRKQAIVNMAAAGLVQIKGVTGKVAQVNAVGSGRQSANPFVIKSGSARLTGTGSTTVKVLVIKPGKINLTGAGRFSARPGGTAVIIPIIIATIVRTPNPAAIIVQTLKPGAGILQTARPVAVITRTDYPAHIVQSSRPTATIVKD